VQLVEALCYKPEGRGFDSKWCPFCRKTKSGFCTCAITFQLASTEEKISVHVLCECEALASPRHPHLGYFLLDPEDVMNLIIGVIWNCGK